MTDRAYEAEEPLVGGKRPPDPAGVNGMVYREPPRPEPKLALKPPGPRGDALEQARRG